MAEKIMPMKNSNEIIGHRTRDLQACSAVPQPTAPPRGTLNDINRTVFTMNGDIPSSLQGMYELLILVYLTLISCF